MAAQKRTENERQTLPNSKGMIRLKATFGVPSLRGSTPIHWTSMAASFAPQKMVLQNPTKTANPMEYSLSQLCLSEILEDI